MAAVVNIHSQLVILLKVASYQKDAVAWGSVSSLEITTFRPCPVSDPLLSAVVGKSTQCFYFTETYQFCNVEILCYN